LKSKPRFVVVDASDKTRFIIRRVDAIGCLPVGKSQRIVDAYQNTQLASQDVRFNLVGSAKNYRQLGLNKPTWTIGCTLNMHHVPTANDMVINTYNTTGLDDDTTEEGFVMTSQYATAEFTLVASNSLTAKQMMVFPCFPSLNCHGAILVSCPQLSKNVF
jgi:hypothetical protein